MNANEMIVQKGRLNYNMAYKVLYMHNKIYQVVDYICLDYFYITFITFITYALITFVMESFQAIITVRN